ncbi:hypothetical protein PYW07_000233 [Mythimna separata]|uniref:Reverse transcriptase domain-containing protein n=1 Tax=Mythimna separata TaxID=271217 RepID=A0AAD8E1C5_MYTSE|nr:hypothetical protein PYW07_000233 [Mythimna separata]
MTAGTYGLTGFFYAYSLLLSSRSRSLIKPHKFYQGNQFQHDVYLMQEDIDRLITWCCHNKISLNNSKCSHIKFTRKVNPVNSAYQINGVNLCEVDVVRDLGVILDSKLTFVPHVENIISRSQRMLGFVIRNGKVFKSPLTKLVLYNSLVRSILEYCSVIWRPHYATHSLRIERIQKRFIRYLGYSKGRQFKYLSYHDRLGWYKMSSLEARRKVLDLRFAYKLLNNTIDCPQLVSKFSFRVPRVPPRKPITPLAPPLRRTVFGANSPIPRMCKLINERSDLVDVHADSISVFVKNLNM